MANMISERKTGAQGATVAANVQRLMEEQNLNSNSLARKIAEIEQPTELADGTVVHPSKLAALAIRRIVAGERKVDVDDLVLLAYSLGVSPVTLLQPWTPRGADPILSPLGEVTSGKYWNWIVGQTAFGVKRWHPRAEAVHPDDRGDVWEQRMYVMESTPAWSAEAGEAAWQDMVWDLDEPFEE
ncbi:helix-turn-helix domain-containing protein [Corynebacterium variabile]|uniref:helix-turn-helix domain-containing protein n=1 Tax=Corynebacterium variabile TaxID=1727 RepID=UPI0028AB9F4C|nr:helix-turn-helix transcriptional regulator [Corynebacterium variabile]